MRFDAVDNKLLSQSDFSSKSFLYETRGEFNQVKKMMSRKKKDKLVKGVINGASIPSPSRRKCIFQRTLLFKGRR